MPPLTVVVPIYEVDTYLRRCVNSICNQTLYNFELILVDDGSPDCCASICDEYAYANSDVYVIHQLNGGLSAARNAGIDWAIAASHSKWISFIDSDDWVHPQYLEYLYAVAKDNKVSLSACGYQDVDGACEIDGVDDPSVEVLNGNEYLFSEKAGGASMAWGKLYLKELFRAVRYPVGRIHEDEYVTYKLLNQAGSIACIRKTLYYYFINPEGITRSGYTLKRLDGVKAKEEQCSFYRAIEVHYYQVCVKDLILHIYPYHIVQLNEINESSRADFLRLRGKILILKNIGIVSKLKANERELVLGVYFPALNQVTMPMFNFARLTNEYGVFEAFDYYRRKLKRRDV